MAPVAAAGVWADMAVPVDTFDPFAQPEAQVSQKGKKSPAKMQALPSNVQDAVLTAKVNANVGNDIRWDVIMQMIQETDAAPPRHVTPVIKVGLPLKSKREVAEDSTSAGETTDSDSLGDDDSPKAGLRPPPGLSPPAAPAMLPPPGLSAPPGLEDVPPPPGFEDVPPPPGFEFGTDSSPDSTPKAMPPWKKNKVEKAKTAQGSSVRPWRKH